MNRMGFLILSILQHNGATDRLSSMTVRELMEMEAFGYKENTISKRLKEFEQSGFVGRGLKEGHAGTYYITESGNQFLNQEKGK